MPLPARDALGSLEISLLEGRASNFRAQVSSAGACWFSLVEGSGVVRMKGAAVDAVPAYALLAISLRGQNRSSGQLKLWPRPGEMVLMPWEAPTDIINVGEFRYLIAHIPRVEIEAAAREHGMEIPYFRSVSAFIGAGAVLSSMMRTLAGEAGRPSSQAVLAQLLPEIIRLLLRAFELEEPRGPMRGERSGRIARIRDYLEAHLADRSLSAEQAARACGLSKRQLFRAFTEARLSFSATLRRMRVDKARDVLVLHPDISIGEVAAIVGFSGAAQFCRAFGADAGCTPTAYRKRELRVVSMAGEIEEDGA
mgnify:CR=1 FL=1